MSEKRIPHYDEITLHLSDLRALSERTCASYWAVISLDLSQRESNRQDVLSTHVIFGDNLESAIAQFKKTDDSSGLFDSDFSDAVMTIAFQCQM